MVLKNKGKITIGELKSILRTSISQIKKTIKLTYSVPTFPRVAMSLGIEIRIIQVRNIAPRIINPEEKLNFIMYPVFM